MIHCLTCGAEITDPKPTQKFCRGSACRSAYWHKTHQARCPNCGTALRIMLVIDPLAAVEGPAGEVVALRSMLSRREAQLAALQRGARSRG